VVQLYGKKVVHHIVAHLEGVRSAVHREAEEVGKRADGYLAEAKATTRWHNIGNPASTGHRVDVEVTQHDVDSTVDLVGPNAMAVEFGHEPSGYFAGTKTRPPHGLYILTHATGLTDLSS
jgi:hypothetical protein